VGRGNAICQTIGTDRDGRVLRNWILGVLATGLWIGNYVVYFWFDLVDWRVRRRAPGPRRRPDSPGPLPRTERRPFPPPEPTHPVREAEVVPPPPRRRRRS
jgi:hypothetical protein